MEPGDHEERLRPPHRLGPQPNPRHTPASVLRARDAVGRSVRQQDRHLGRRVAGGAWPHADELRIVIGGHVVLSQVRAREYEDVDAMQVRPGVLQARRGEIGGDPSRDCEFVLGLRTLCPTFQGCACPPPGNLHNNYVPASHKDVPAGAGPVGRPPTTRTRQCLAPLSV
jgi:hypothetical protein